MDDNTEVWVRDEIMTLGEWKEWCRKQDEATPWQREQRMFDEAIWHLRKAADLMGLCRPAEFDALVMSRWTEE
jgi:hypothetical protein